MVVHTIEKCQDGVTLQELSREYGLTVREVFDILWRHKLYTVCSSDHKLSHSKMDEVHRILGVTTKCMKL